MVALSSCEPEHGRGACDGMFIQRCLAFLVDEGIAHEVFTGSSSARQIVVKQRVGKLRRVDAKILRVQDRIMMKTFGLNQVGTVWNISDIGTRAAPSAPHA